MSNGIRSFWIVWICLGLHMGPRAAFAQSAQVPLELRFGSKDFPAKVEVYEPHSDVMHSISETRALPSRAELPVIGKPLKFMSVTRGKHKSAVLVIENTTDKTIYFFAVPHRVDPPENVLGFHFECLCNHTVFQIPARHIWYRVVRVHLGAPPLEAPQRIEHSIIGVKPEDALGKYKDNLFRLKVGR
ncbi:MAG TPA: hypothetical protein PLZ57_00840 [Pseudobdellovibrionaceae bacterium]|nr:hypothetical protein [Pseudobdellovibrionaceae bacterium]